MFLGPILCGLLSVPVFSARPSELLSLSEALQDPVCQDMEVEEDSVS